jgi:hypothetical protein
MKKEIILTVHNAGNNHRLALAEEDMASIKPNEAEILSVSFGENIFVIEGALSTYKKYGTLGAPEIYSWLKENDYNDYENNKNTKLIFTILVEDNNHYYELYKNQAV